MSLQSLSEAMKMALRKAAMVVNILSDDDEDVESLIQGANEKANDVVLEISNAMSILKHGTVTVQWLDDEGSLIEETFKVGDTKEVGSILISQLTVKEIRVEAEE